MKKPSQLLLCFLLINLVLISCSHNKSPITAPGTGNTDTTKSQLLTFDLKRLPDISTIKLSEIGATDIEYIPLKTTTQNVTPQIISIIFGKNYFLTRYYTGLNMFRYDGTFISEVGNKGRGPNEFITISDVDIDPGNESVYIADGQQPKFLVFNKNGEIIRTFKSPLTGFLKFKFTKDGILCHYNNNHGNIQNSLALIDTTGKIFINYPNKYPWERIIPGVLYENENIFYRFNNQLFKKEIYSDTIFVYNDKVFEPHIIIEVGEQRLTTNARSNVRTFSDAKSVLTKFLTPFNLFQFSDFIYYEFGVTINGVHDLKSFIGSKKKNFEALFVPYEGIINDIDGGPNIWPKTVRNDSTIVSWIEALKFKEYISSETFKNSIPKYPDKKKQLEKLAENIKETDNPVLIFIKIK